MTIRELAKSLGLSKTTVADALNGRTVVSEQTRAFVQQRARDLGYRPNPAASNFLRQIRSRGRRGHRGNIAYLASLRPDQSFAESGYAQRLFHAGARQCAAALGYEFHTLSVHSPGMKPGRLANILSSRGVSGLIVGPLFVDAGALELDWSRFSAISAGFSLRTPRLHRVGHHCAHGMMQVFEECRARGLSRIGLALTAEGDLRLEHAWTGAFLTLQRNLPEANRVNPLILPVNTWNAREQTRWLRRAKPDAIIVQAAATWLCDTSARGHPPVFSLDHKPEDRHPGIDQRHEQCGQLAMQLLSAQILHNESGVPNFAVTHLVEGIWRQ